MSTPTNTARRRGRTLSRTLTIGSTVYPITPPMMNGNSAGHEATTIQSTAATAPSPSTSRPACLGVTLAILIPRSRHAWRDCSARCTLGLVSGAKTSESGIVVHLLKHQTGGRVHDRTIARRTANAKAWSGTGSWSSGWIVVSFGRTHQDSRVRPTNTVSMIHNLKNLSARERKPMAPYTASGDVYPPVCRQSAWGMNQDTEVAASAIDPKRSIKVVIRAGLHSFPARFCDCVRESSAIAFASAAGADSMAD